MTTHTVEFEHKHAKYRAVFEDPGDDLSIHHVTTRCGVPFERRMHPSATPGLEVPVLIQKSVDAWVDQVLG